jgi:hypothetical protein
MAELEYGKCENCSYRGIDGGPGPVMVCNHPQQTADYGAAISWKTDPKDGQRKRTPDKDKCPLGRPTL